jgi:hypothetical protein
VNTELDKTLPSQLDTIFTCRRRYGGRRYINWISERSTSPNLIALLKAKMIGAGWDEEEGRKNFPARNQPTRPSAIPK